MAVSIGVTALATSHSKSSTLDQERPRIQSVYNQVLARLVANPEASVGTTVRQLESVSKDLQQLEKAGCVVLFNPNPETWRDTSDTTALRMVVLEETLHGKDNQTIMFENSSSRFFGFVAPRMQVINTVPWWHQGVAAKKDSVRISDLRAPDADL